MGDRDGEINLTIYNSCDTITAFYRRTDINGKTISRYASAHADAPITISCCSNAGRFLPCTFVSINN